ncbi:MAG: diguanylate cyclase [Ruminiclostridium sp.]|nr:diguanylate cyclase [Ruminiclostridium sp.]
MNIKVKTALRAILIGATVIPLIVVALVATLQIFGFAKTMIGDESANVGAAQSAVVTNIVESYANDVTAFAAMDTVNRSITDLNKVKDGLDDITAALKKSGSVLDLVVSDSEGGVIYSSKGIAVGTHFFALDDNSGSKSSAFTSKFFPGESTYGADVFAVTAPLSGSGSGFVSVVVDIAKIADPLSKTGFLGSGRLVVTDAETVVNYNGAAVSSNAELSAALTPDIQTMLSTNANEVGEKITEGQYLGAYGNVKNTNWVWISIYPASEATGAVMLVFIVGMVIIAALILVCVLVMVIATQKVIDPMLNMLSTMKEINSGNHSERITTAGMGKEFAGMSEVFNTMMDESLMSEELHKTVSDISDNMLFEWDFAKENMFVSDNFKEKIGLNVSGATLNNGKFLDSLMDEDDSEKYKRDMNTLFKDKGDVGGEYKIKNASGQEMWVSMRARCITDRLGEVLRVIGVLTDITSEKNATLKLAERASFDFLSQLYNRNTFEREFAAELERSVGKKVAALFIDVDDFKFINDRYSHAVGDEVIRFVADVIKSKTGETGFAGRFGGDEFVLCISDPKLVENVEVLSMDIIDDLYSGYYSKSVDTTLNIKASIGIAIYPDHSTDGKELVGCADAAMYFVKKNGKANYHIFVPEDNQLEGNHSYSL